MKFVKRFKWRVDRLLDDDAHEIGPWKWISPYCRQCLNPTNGFSSEEEAIEALNSFGERGKYILVTFFIPETGYNKR